MLTYTSLKDRPREFLAATGLRHEEFARLLPAFAATYAVLYPLDKTLEGKVRQRGLVKVALHFCGYGTAHWLSE